MYLDTYVYDDLTFLFLSGIRLASFSPHSVHYLPFIFVFLIINRQSSASELFEPVL